MNDELKNVTDYAEDLLASERPDAAIVMFRAAHRLLLRWNREKPAAFLKRHAPTDALFRIGWNTGEAHFRIYKKEQNDGDLFRAKRLLRWFAKLANRENRWSRLAYLENSWKDPAGFLRAYNCWLGSIAGLNESQRADIPIRNIRHLLRSRFFVFQESGLGNIDEAALANRWQAAFCHERLAQLANDPDDYPEGVYGKTGGWLLKRGYPQLAFECWLNAMRSFNQEQVTINQPRFQARINDLMTASRACGRWGLASSLVRLIPTLRGSTPELPTLLYDDIDRLVWLEAAGSKSALQLCVRLADQYVLSDGSALNPHFVRLVADGLFLVGDSRAAALYRLLMRITPWPEEFFASCLLRATPEATGATAAISAP